MHFVQQLKKVPFHIACIILFFLTHGYSEYVGLIPFTGMLYFFVVQLLVAALFFLFFWLRLRSITKAGLLTTFILLFYLFYGAIADSLKEVSFLAALSHYRYLLSAFILGTILLFIYFRRSAGNFQKATLYLNSVFIFLILYDIGYIALSRGNNPQAVKDPVVMNFGQGHFDKKPDIYFIVMDEYSGSNTLRRYFNYDNSGFENMLKQRGFFVASSPLCNYTSTAYSVASMLSMDYLNWLQQKKETAIDYAAADKVISNNNVMQLLKQSGYELYNYSIFDIDNQPSRFNPGLFSFKLKLITHKMLLNRMEKDLLWNLRVKIGGKIDWIGEGLQQKFKTGNEKIIRLTKAISEKNAHPKFVYAHLLMPHAPFFYDSSGSKMNINIFNRSIDANDNNKAYLQYLVYTNKVVAALMNDLLEKTKKQAVIVLMSDHGYRSLYINGKYIIPDNNFNAVYIPGNDYRQFYDSISNVNQFRVLFNTLFETKLPLLPDSCSCN